MSIQADMIPTVLWFQGCIVKRLFVLFDGLNTYPVSQERPSPIMNTSAKTNLGHLEASAGMAGTTAKLSQLCWQDATVQKRPRRSQMCQHSEEQYLPIQQPSQNLACNILQPGFLQFQLWYPSNLHHHIPVRLSVSIRS